MSIKRQTNSRLTTSVRLATMAALIITLLISVPSGGAVRAAEIQSVESASVPGGGLAQKPIDRQSVSVSVSEAPTVVTANVSDALPVVEAATNMVFTVTLSASPVLTSTLQWDTQDGSATGDTDYTISGGTLNFPANTPNISVVVSVPIRSDTTDELDENLFVVLSFATGDIAIGDGTGEGVIIDNDQRVNFGTPVPNPVPEGDGATNPEVVLTATLSRASLLQITAPWSTDAADPADPGLDFVADSGSLVFLPGETQKAITLTVLSDDLFEANETFDVNWGTVINGRAGTKGTVTIGDDDDSSAPTLSIESAIFVDETDVSPPDTFAVITATLSTTSELTIRASYATTSIGGTATEEVDYNKTTRNNATIFTAGDKISTVIEVEIFPDLVDEYDETFYLNLSNVTCTNRPTCPVTVSNDTSLVTIVDNDPLAVLQYEDAALLEGDPGDVISVTFPIALSVASDKPITVTYTTVDNSATAGTDYVATSGVLTFTPGVTTTPPIIVSLIGDNDVELDETFFLEFTGDGDVDIPAPGHAIATIWDDETPGIFITDVDIDPEGDTGTTQAVFTVTLSEPSAQTVSVDFITADDTAQAGADYTTNSGTLTFAPGDTAKTAVVDVLGDAFDEFDETFTVNLSNPISTTIRDATGVGTIIDDDPLAQLSIDDQATIEPDTGTANMVFNVSLALDTYKIVTVDYIATNGTAEVGVDYQATSGTLTFNPGETGHTITVPLIGDVIPEADETLTVVLNNVQNGAITDASGAGTILDNEARPVLSFAGPASVNEGNSGTVQLDYTVSLNKQSASEITVDYATSDGTAVAGTDYQAISGTLTFPANSTTPQEFSVLVNGDVIDEFDKAFNITLSNAVNAEVGNPTQLVTIIDDDEIASITIGDVTVEEGDSAPVDAAFTVNLSSVSGKTITVNYATANDSAIAGSDYTTTSGTLTFNPGETGKTFTVPILSDNQGENDEQFKVNLSAPTNATISKVQSLVSVIDDDGLLFLPINGRNFVPPGLVANPKSGLVTHESGGTATFAVTLRIKPQGPTTIQVTSLTPDEVQISPDTLTFDETTFGSPQIVTVTGLDDLEIDGEAAFEIELKVTSAEPDYMGLKTTVKGINRDNDVFEDYFTSNLGWAMSPETGASAVVADNVYLLRALNAASKVKAVSPLPAGTLPALYAVDADVRMTSGANRETGYGLLFDWINSRRFYRFNIYPDTQTWEVYLYNDKWSLVASGSSAAILTGFDTNHLRVERIGATIRVFANGELLWEGSEDTFTNGTVGVILVAPDKLGATEYAEAAFDNYVISNLNP